MSLRCFAHTLNLIVQNGLKKISAVLSKTTAIVQYFHKSTNASDKLKFYQNEGDTLKLIMDVSTRWYSTFFMLEQISKLKEPVQAALGALNNAVLELTKSKWMNVSQICKEFLSHLSQ